MPPLPDPTATNPFEFEVLREAKNYRKAVIREFAPYLKGKVIEVGAGIGQNTALLGEFATIASLLSIEPENDFCRQFKTQYPTLLLAQATIRAVQPANSDWDAILSINVLEHIREDGEELAAYARLLQTQQGALCLFVPARAEIYAPLDGDFGHFRRYSRPALGQKLNEAGFSIRHLYYFNWVGYFAWWLNFCVLRKRRLDVASVRIFDRMIFPFTYYLESHFLRPPFGQSLVAIAAAKPA